MRRQGSMCDSVGVLSAVSSSSIVTAPPASSAVCAPRSHSKYAVTFNSELNPYSGRSATIQSPEFELKKKRRHSQLKAINRCQHRVLC